MPGFLVKLRALLFSPLRKRREGKFPLGRGNGRKPQAKPGSVQRDWVSGKPFKARIRMGQIGGRAR